MDNAVGMAYTPASKEVQGILQSQTDITTKDEAENKETYKKTMEAFFKWDADMLHTIHLLKEDKAKEEKAKADTEVEIAEDLEVKDNTVAQREADKAFLADATQSCIDYEAEYNNRVELRNQELSGVHKALEILDSKRDLLRTTFKEVEAPSFLQLDIEQSSAASIAMSLKQAAKKAHSLRLASVAAYLYEALPAGAFDTVIDKIGSMQDKIKLEASTDTEKKDYCKAEYATVARKSKKLTFLIDKGEAEIEKLDNRIKQLNKEKSQAIKEIADIDAELDEALTIRTQEHQTFLNNKADDEEAVTTLKETYDALHEYYENHTDGAHPPKFLQLDSDPDQLSSRVKQIRDSENKKSLTKKDSQRQTSTMVFALIDRISENLEKEIEDSRADEREEQLAYEKARDLLQASKEKLNKSVADLEEMLGNSGEKKDTETEDRDTNVGDLTAQTDYKDSIKQECDWLLQNFDDRVQKREQEKEGLARAKELLSGASFVQQKEVSPHHSIPVAEETQAQSTDLQAPEVPETAPQVQQAESKQHSSLLAYLRR
eukprot:TRINITY_DN4474_c0_g1_i2.p1 TRINITY_DN4474_c0_g1~~TRINITY_DN4474_c0_g1_i2.p1  ORF type:complete len:545 (-),score=181.52 TRINITY_DN4474_c0_g1_i2:21-1655(-)